MRDIIFKAKRKDNGEWVKGDLLRETDVFENVITRIYVMKDHHTFIKHEVVPETVSQYTGLTDRNGNRIWENDITRQFADCNELGDNLYFFYSIKWDNKYARFYGEEISLKEKILFDDLEDMEVIGNVFDNADLLEG